MNQFVVSTQFKARVSDILATKKFSVVFPFMNLINREGDVYQESQLNQLVQFVGELPYNEVAEFFNLMPELVKPFNPGAVQDNSTPAQTESADESPVTA